MVKCNSEIDIAVWDDRTTRMMLPELRISNSGQRKCFRRWDVSLHIIPVAATEDERDLKESWVDGEPVDRLKGEREEIRSKIEIDSAGIEVDCEFVDDSGMCGRFREGERAVL